MRSDPLRPLTVEEIVPGLMLGHFQIQEEISRGGMGVVFKALEPDLNRVVALKVLSSKYALDESYVKSFQEEAKLVASLRHPHVIPIYYIGQIGEVVFYSMAFIPNPSLDHWIQESHRFDFREVKWFLTQVCSALDCATKAGLIHLDIKPSNFLVDENGSLILTDFGLAKSLGGAKGVTDHQLYGTPSYVAPERIQEKELDHRTDIYSLGTSLFHLVVGEPPFDSESMYEIVEAHLTAPFPEEKALEKGVPQPLIDLIRKMMEKDPVRRFQSYGEILSAVQGLDHFHYKPAIPLSIKEMEYAVPDAYAELQTIEGLLWVGMSDRSQWIQWLNADASRDWQTVLPPLLEMEKVLGETLNLGKLQGMTLLSDEFQSIGCMKGDGFVLASQVVGGDLEEIQQSLRSILNDEGASS
jgi:serine/threonine protein kinase